MSTDFSIERPIGVTREQALAEKRRLEREAQHDNETTPQAIAAKAAKLVKPDSLDRQRFGSILWHG
jgi:hypothetical protein